MIVGILTVYILCKIVCIAKRNKTRASKPTEMGEISIDSIVNTQYLLITLISGQLPILLCNLCNTIDLSHFVSTPKFEPILQQEIVSRASQDRSKNRSTKSDTKPSRIFLYRD